MVVILKVVFLGDDLSFCYEVTRYLQLVIMESLGE